MSKLIFIAPAMICVGALAQASPLRCAGSYLNYNVSMQAQAAGTHVRGPVQVLITQTSGETTTSRLTVTSSDVRPGRYIHLTASGKDGAGSLVANFNGQTYTGTLNATTKYGNAAVDVTCTIGGRAEREEGQDLGGDNDLE